MILSLFFVSLAALAVLAAIFYRCLTDRFPSEGIRLDWVVDTSAPHYRNILSALEPNASLKQRMEQRRVMRRNLVSLRGDFNKLTYMVKQLIAVSPRDRPDLSAVLLRHSVLFNLLVLLVEWRLVMHVFGGRVHRARFFVNIAVSVLQSVRELASALTAQFLIEGA